MSTTTTPEKRLPGDHLDRDLISISGLDQTLFVEAGAGTGKTTQLVDRIVNLVLTNKVSLANVAAITFTEAAAAELQARIRVAFETKAVHPETSEKIREACVQAIQDADLAAISTVHGFASRILSEFPVAAGLPPRVTILDEIGSKLAHERRWERFVDKLHNEPTNEEMLIRLSVIGVPLSPNYFGQASFKDVASSFNQNWDRLESLKPESFGTLAPINFDLFDQAVAALEGAPEHCSDPEDKLVRTLEDELLPSMRAIVAIPNSNRKLRALVARTATANAGWKVGRGGKKSAWDIDVKECKDQIRSVTAQAGAIVNQVAHEIFYRLQRLTAQEVVAAARERQANGGLEFHDLLVLAREVLRENSEVRRALHERYQVVLLDEFQDTDPIQIEVASLIAASTVNVNESWEQHKVEDGRLFFVGDAKQSIYRFRRADIELFLKARDRYTAGTAPVKLTTNFRTVAPIIDWVNGLFDEIMPVEVPAAQPRYERLEAWRGADSGADHRPIILGGVHPDLKVKADVLREAEADDVVAVLRSVRDTPEQWPIGVKGKDRSWRPAKLSDVTILIPTRTSLPFLREALESSHIPYRLATGTLVYDTQEIRDALATLRAIDDPTDGISLVAALRSPLYGCSDVELFQYRHAGGRWDLRGRAPQELDPEHRVNQAIEHLHGLWRERWWTGPAELLGQILTDCRANLLAFGHDRPAEVWRRLRFLQDQARLYEETTGADVRGFIDWAGLQSADGARVHEPLLPETDDEAVQISTVHGAKGLEFPITILSGMTTAAKSTRRGVSVLWNDDGEPEVKIRSGLSSLGHEPRADFEAEMDVHEKMRLLYVAATRARDHLVVSTHHKVEVPKKDGTDDPKTFASRLGRFCDAFPDLVQTKALPELPEFPESTESLETTGESGVLSESAYVGEPLALALPFDSPEPDGYSEHDQYFEPSSSDESGSEISDLERRNILAAAKQWQDERDALLAPTRQSRVLSATAIARTVDAALVDEDDDQADQDVLDVGATKPPVVRRKGRTGSAIGTAVHNTLEYLDLANPTDVEQQCARQCDLELIPEMHDTVLAMVRSALASNAVALAVANKHYKELYVAAPLGETMVEGYIDLLIETSEGLIVVDYKTDSARTEAEVDAKLAAYELQGASYAVILEETTGLEVIDCLFVFCNTRGVIERAVVDLEAAKARTRAVVIGESFVTRAP